MKITKATITNFRALSKADFAFDRRFTLIVGVNGVGKSTLLDALRICASRVVPHITASKARPLSFDIADIAKALPFLDVEIGFKIGGKDFHYTRSEWKEKHAKDENKNVDQLRRAIYDTERPRLRVRTLLRGLAESQSVEDRDNYSPSLDAMKAAVDGANSTPNFIFFSTNRSVISEATATISRTVGGEAAAFAEALTPRSWNIFQFSDWMHVQESLAFERVLSKKHLEVIQAVVRRFLHGYENLRPGRADEPRLAIDKNGVTLDVRQLSDGERGVLSLVLDIARRLSQGNPSLKDPLRQGEAVVLIDELDLHLHPKWQRSIVPDLMRTFPRCQFIATTHSPQIVAAVKPEQILLLKDNQVIKPDRSLGMDTNWILRHLMETDERPPETASKLRNIESLISAGKFKKAKAEIALCRHRWPDIPEWAVYGTRITRLEMFKK